jgi:hypothetical protein
MLLSVVAASLIAVAPTSANEFGAFTQIAITGETAPGSGGTFQSFGLPNLGMFVAQDSNGVSGVYAGGGAPVEVIADTTMAAPTGGNYSGFSSPIAGGLGIAFIATTTTNTQLVMGGDPIGGNFGVIAKTGDSPALGETFGSFQQIALGGVFPWGEITSNIGLYAIDGNPDVEISDTPTANFATVPVGAAGAFTSFGTVSTVSPGPGNHITPGYQMEAIAIHGTAGGVEGIYYTGSGGDFTAPWTTLADTATPSIQHFTGFGDPVVTENNITFTASYSTATGTKQGIFAYGPYFYYNPPIGGIALNQIEAAGDVAPDSGGGHFVDFLAVTGGESMNDDIFTATLDNGEEGLYVYTWGWVDANGVLTVPGTTQCILDTTDTLDGKSIADIELSPQGGAWEEDPTFKVDFTDGSQGIYSFEAGVPEPNLLLVPFIAAMHITMRRRKR